MKKMLMYIGFGALLWHTGCHTEKHKEEEETKFW